MNDSYYTPNTLAEYLVSHIKKENVNKIADFCVGEGELLKVAKKKWSNAQFYGTDISNQVIELLKSEFPEWQLEECDFLNSESRIKTNLLNNKFDLILLNPPFTCRGSSMHVVAFDGINYHLSTAMAFIIQAINYLSPNGSLFAILPQSIAYSEKDKNIREYLFDNYNFKIFDEINNQGFKKCSPNIVLAAINDKNVAMKNISFTKLNCEIDNIEIHRGKVSTFKVESFAESSLSFVHTTNLKKNKIESINIRVHPSLLKIRGPAILFNRVGQPNVNKICIIHQNEEYVLSDCIIGIKLKTIKNCKLLKKAIMDNWGSFENLYKGTGAKYITLKRLKYFLNIE